MALSARANATVISVATCLIMTFSFKAVASTTIADKASDLLWARKYHVGAVSYHSGSHGRGCTALRPIVAHVCFEPKIAFPEVACLSVGG